MNSVAERCDGVVKKGRCGKEIHTCLISLKGIISIIAWLQYSMGNNIISQHTGCWWCRWKNERDDDGARNPEHGHEHALYNFFATVWTLWKWEGDMLHQSDEFKYHPLNNTALLCGCLLQCPGLGLGFSSKAPGGQRVETQGGGGSRLQILPLCCCSQWMIC